jgi:hypothetical protein
MWRGIQKKAKRRKLKMFNLFKKRKTDDYYLIDLDKVHTVDDIKLLLRGLMPTKVSKDYSEIEKVRHLLKGE